MLGQIQLLFSARFNPRKRLVTISPEDSLREDVANVTEDRTKERAQTGLDDIRPRSFYLCKLINSLFPNSNLQWILWPLQPNRNSDGPPLEAHLWGLEAPQGEKLWPAGHNLDSQSCTPNALSSTFSLSIPFFYPPVSTLAVSISQRAVSFLKLPHLWDFCFHCPVPTIFSQLPLIIFSASLKSHLLYELFPEQLVFN